MLSGETRCLPSRALQNAVLDDYQNVALSLADWSVLDARATVTVFNDHLADSDAVVERLQPFDIVCVMRERTPMTRTIIERLPKLRMIASTATRNASIDLKAAEERGVQVVHTGYTSAPTIELTWALILGSARNLVAENTSLRGGGWQQSVGDDMAGRTLGVLGLGNVGGAVAQIGNAFGMKVIAWSQNLTTERAAEVGATLVSKDELFQEADVVSIHLVLSGRTRGLVGAAELALMKPTARLINTSRGPIVVEADLVAALKDKTIAGAAIDVFDQEPLPLDHPFRALPNLLATPHIGYVSRGLYARFYQDTVANICRWLDGQAARLTQSRQEENARNPVQRLSQAALSRSRFLRLAAGALLPFVGLRLSAAAAANLNWRKTVARPGPRMQRRRAAWGPSS